MGWGILGGWLLHVLRITIEMLHRNKKVGYQDSKGPDSSTWTFISVESYPFWRSIDTSTCKKLEVNELLVHTEISRVYNKGRGALSQLSCKHEAAMSLHYYTILGYRKGLHRGGGGRHRWFEIWKTHFLNININGYGALPAGAIWTDFYVSQKFFLQWRKKVFHS